MNTTATYLDSDSCPACGSGLHLADDGTAVISWHCAACGWAVTGDMEGQSGGSR
jgi:hypothetical protein